jgi:hypothetical protein
MHIYVFFVYQTKQTYVESPVKRNHLMLNEHHIFMKTVYTYA